MRRKRGEGLAKRLWDFIDNNRDEELTVEVAVRKFDCTPREVYQSVCELAKKHGKAIESVHVIRHRSKGIAS